MLHLNSSITVYLDQAKIEFHLLLSSDLYAVSIQNTVILCDFFLYCTTWLNLFIQETFLLSSLDFLSKNIIYRYFSFFLSHMHSIYIFCTYDMTEGVHCFVSKCGESRKPCFLFRRQISFFLYLMLALGFCGQAF